MFHNIFILILNIKRDLKFLGLEMSVFACHGKSLCDVGPMINSHRTMINNQELKG